MARRSPSSCAPCRTMRTNCAVFQPWSASGASRWVRPRSSGVCPTRRSALAPSSAASSLLRTTRPRMAGSSGIGQTPTALSGTGKQATTRACTRRGARQARCHTCLLQAAPATTHWKSSSTHRQRTHACTLGMPCTSARSMGGTWTWVGTRPAQGGLTGAIGSGSSSAPPRASAPESASGGAASLWSMMATLCVSVRITAT
mmetsp:Transcript_69432/g.192119  ORF Transcript_69432/g.192119 Transcript_69432/m.192119 type:complete len:201 (-) Transcript_69432:581-1183(-)